jgi:exonuclease III
VLDGRWDDWQGIPAAATGTSEDAAALPLGIREIRVRHDARNVFFYFEFARPVVPQGLDGTVALHLNADGDSSTGVTLDGLRGVDLSVVLSPSGPSPESTPSGAQVWQHPATGPTFAAPADTAGVMLAPSYASDRLELQIARGTPAGPEGMRIFTGGTFRARAVAYSHAQPLHRGPPSFSYALTPAATRPTPRGHASADPLARAPGTSFRLLSWNVNGAGLRRNPEPFIRALAAIRPDVVLLDEVLPADRTLVDTLLAAIPGTGAWHVVFGEAGGRQRGVIASRRPVAGAASLARIPYPDSISAVFRDAPQATVNDTPTGDGVPTAGAVVTVDGRRLLLATVDLKCCGTGAGSPEDRIRRIEARAMADALRPAARAERADAVIVAGDYNLVGSRAPLDVMRGNAADGDSFAVSDAPRLDGLSYATWARPRNRFAPGRLDYHLYTPAALHVLDAFAFDTADLSPRWLAAHGLRAGDSVAASGHRPVVSDFAWGPAAR